MDGGAGNDRMVGGTGNDTFTVDSASDVVEELANAGCDLVRTSLASYSLGANVENLTYIGATGFKGAGNALDNTIIGGKAADRLYGLDGNDRLFGGAGKDTLSGGVGADVFQFNTAGESTRAAFDVIADFMRGHGDRIDLSVIDANARLAGNQAFSFIGAAAFKGIAGQLNFQGQHLRGDINGDRVADFDIHLVGVSSMIVADMFL
jgi:Ca2+-binding RTX toxin-like protein